MSYICFLVNRVTEDVMARLVTSESHGDIPDIKSLTLEGWGVRRYVLLDEKSPTIRELIALIKREETESEGDPLTTILEVLRQCYLANDTKF